MISVTDSKLDKHHRIVEKHLAERRGRTYHRNTTGSASVEPDVDPILGFVEERGRYRSPRD